MIDSLLYGLQFAVSILGIAGSVAVLFVLILWWLD